MHAAQAIGAGAAQQRGWSVRAGVRALCEGDFRAPLRLEVRVLKAFQNPSKTLHGMPTLVTDKHTTAPLSGDYNGRSRINEYVKLWMARSRTGWGL